MRYISTLLSRLHGVRLVGLAGGLAVAGATGCSLEDLAGDGTFACTGSGQCLSTYHCDLERQTCVRGAEPDAGARIDGTSSDSGPNRDANPYDIGVLRPDAQADAGETDAEGELDVAIVDDAALDLGLPEDGGPLDMVVSLDSEVPRPFCETAEEFADCGANPATQSRCIRQRCCDPAVLDHHCNPIGPGFPSPYGVLPNERFRVVLVPILQVGSDLVIEQSMIVDLGTGLSWLPLNLNFATVAAAAQGCRDVSIADLGEDGIIVNLLNPPSGLRDGSRPRLPDAYELWSLLSFVAPTDRNPSSPAQLFRSAGYSPEMANPDGRIATSVATAAGSALVVDYATREMVLAPPDSRVRAICVVGGHRPGAGTEAGRDQVNIGSDDWFDRWSGRTWRSNGIVNLNAGPPPDTRVLADGCNDLQAGAVLPTIFDVVTRFDIRNDPQAPDRLATYDRALPGDAKEIPIIVAEPIQGPRLAVEPHRMFAFDLTSNVLPTPEREYDCLTPPDP